MPRRATKTREELLKEQGAARRRRDAAPPGSDEYRHAIEDVGRIEVEIARVEREMKPPRV